MPFYEFYCNDCKEKREMLVKMDAKDAVCPICLSEMNRIGGFKTVSTGLPNGFFTNRSKRQRIEE